MFSLVIMLPFCLMMLNDDNKETQQELAVHDCVQIISVNTNCNSQRQRFTYCSFSFFFFLKAWQVCLPCGLAFLPAHTLQCTSPKSQSDLGISSSPVCSSVLHCLDSCQEFNNKTLMTVKTRKLERQNTPEAAYISLSC